MFPQFGNAITADVPLKDKVTYFSSINLFHGANINERQCKEIKEKIKELLEYPITRCDGLLLLESALQQDMPFYIEIWPEIIMANLKVNDVTCQDIIYRILKLILKPSKYSIHMSTAEYYIPKIAQLLTESNNANCLPAIQCLSICMNYCPGVTLVLKDQLESYIIKQMDTNSTQVCDGISDCFVNFLRGLAISHAVKNSNIHKTYLFYYKKTLHTLQDIVNKLTNATEVLHMDNDNDVAEIFPLPNIPSTQFSSTMMLARMYSSFSTCAAKIICSEGPDKKLFEVPILQIFDFINSVLSIAQRAESNEQGELIRLVFPIIQKATFVILESLIQNFELLEQVENIIFLIRKSVESSYDSFSTFNICQIRCISWKVLNIWIDKTGTQVTYNAGNKKFLIEELLKDIIPESIEEITVMQRQQHSSLKGKKTDCAFPPPDENSNFNKMKIETHNEALIALKKIVNSASPFLEENFKEQIASCVLTTAKSVQKCIHPQKKFPFPYISDRCRKNLYELCLAIAVSSNFHNRVLNQSLAVLKVAQKDQSLEIKEFCRIAILWYKFVLHPKKKFPEVLINKKALFESTVEETVCFGWDNVRNWNANNSDRENHSVHVTPIRPDNHVELSPHNVNENARQNSYTSEKVYRAAESYVKDEIQCNGDDMSEVPFSSQSESESEEEGTNETAEEENISETPKPFISTVHSAEVVRKEVPVNTDVDSEEDNLSVAEEEQEYSRMDEEESSTHKAAFHADQNGVASMSEEEILSSSKGENGEYSSEEEGSFEEEEEEIKEFDDDEKPEVEDLEEMKPPMKRQRISEESDRSQEELSEIKTEGT